jgi:hypothetical protein
VSTAARVLDVARSQIGTVAARDGSNPYGRAYGMDRVAYCAQFVWWCFREAGASHLIPKTAYTPTFASWFQQRGQAPASPAPGDLVFYDFPDSLRRIQHVGLVEAVNANGTITTVEGNTTSGSAGSQDRGGGVWRRTRSTSAVKVWGRPAYTGPAAPQAAPAGFDPQRMATLSRGMGPRDSRVMALQRWLNAYDWQPHLPLITTDPAKGFGTYGPATQGVIRSAQAQCGITGPDADGSVVGPRTKAAFAARGARW